jgi:DNA-binding NarL/FixJ family response regulator
MRVAYRRILESESNLRIVAMAANGEEASKLAAETRPDVAILDVRMPKVDGIQAAHEIRRNNLKTSIVVISAYDDLAFVADLMRYGVEKKAYLLKYSLSDITGLIRIVEAVHRGQTILDSGIVQRMARLFCKHSDLLDTDLCGEEQDLLGLMAEGYSDDRVCATLHLDRANVERQ